jgi:hypothetical protein
MAKLTRGLFLVLLGGTLACGSDGGRVDAGPADGPSGGQFELAWLVEDPAGGILDCGEVSGGSVIVSATPLDGLAGFSETFTCGTGGGTSGVFPSGRYELSMDLRVRGGGASLLTQPVTLPEITLSDGHTIDAGRATFEVEPSGSASFRLGVAGGGSICDPVDQDGAGLTGLTIELTDGDGACINGAELTVGAGGGAAGTYTTSCDAPPVFGCIENDQVITTGVRKSGRYGVTIAGQKAGPIDCFSLETGFDVPGNGLAGDGGSFTLTLASTASCDPSLEADAGP